MPAPDFDRFIQEAKRAKQYARNPKDVRDLGSVVEKLAEALAEFAAQLQEQERTRERSQRRS